MEDLHTVGRNGLQHGDTGGQCGKNRRHEEQNAHNRSGFSHDRKYLRQGNKHQAGTCAHTVGAGKHINCRDDHHTSQQRHTGVKQFDLVHCPVQIHLRLHIRTIGDHDTHGHAQGEKQLTHGIQQNLQEAFDRQPFHMGRDIVQEALHTGAHLAGSVRAVQRQGINGDDHHQHQQNGHHKPGYLLDTILHAVVHDQRRHAHKQQGKHHRGYRRGDKSGEVVILGSRLGLSRHIHHCIFRDPAANHRIVGHDQHRHQERQNAQEFPPGPHFCVRADGALVGFPSNGNV